jgi:hypothetical protein
MVNGCREMQMSERQDVDGREGPDEARRDFLKRCGKYAVVTPPAVTLMLSAASKPTRAGGYHNNTRNAVTNYFYKNHAK